MNQNVLWNNRICSTYDIHKVSTGIYYDLLLPERNVEVKSLTPFDIHDIKEKDFVTYQKNGEYHIVLVVKLDKLYDYAQIRILKCWITTEDITFGI